MMTQIQPSPQFRGFASYVPLSPALIPNRLPLSFNSIPAPNAAWVPSNWQNQMNTVASQAVQPLVLQPVVVDPLKNRTPQERLPKVWVQNRSIVLREKEPWTREGVIRYWGYLNEVTTAFRKMIGETLWKASNWFSALYGVVDTVVVARQENKDSQALPKKERNKRVAKVAADAFLFQVVASVYIPQKIVDTLREKVFERYFESKIKQGVPRYVNMSENARKLWPAVLSLACIPAMAPVIDRSIDWLMNRTTRYWMKMPPTHTRLHFQEVHTRRYHKTPPATPTAPIIVPNSTHAHPETDVVHPLSPFTFKSLSKSSSN